MVIELPNKLFSNGRSVLAKFGYRHLQEGQSRDDWAEMWEHLRGDFPVAGGHQAPAFDALSEPQKEAARDYMGRRLKADQLLEACETLHVQLFSSGIETGLVERYAVARDEYEESVEDFGAARKRLEGLLRS